MWYPLKKEELEKQLEQFLDKNLIKQFKSEKINGVIVPHAGYEYSGAIVGKAFSYLKGFKRAVILAPSHHFPINLAVTHNENFWETPLGKINIKQAKLRKANLIEEHAIDNQIPFLQKLGFEEIIPIMIGKINEKEALLLAKQIEDYSNDSVFIISTDLSHFLEDNYARIRDRETIKIIKNLELEQINKIDACGIYPLRVLINLCKIKNWKPELIDYQTSADITKDKSSVVGYASFKF